MNAMQEQKPTKELSKAKGILRDLGLSYRKAAPILGVTYQYLSEVLNGHHTSKRLTAKIENLPKTLAKS